VREGSLPAPFALSQVREPAVRRLANPDGSVYGANVLSRLAGGQLAMEAENFYMQGKTAGRMWQLVSKTLTPRIGPDSDPPHVEGASEDAYLELLPGVRQKDEDKMHSKSSIAPEGGRDAVLTYMIRFPAAGKYYVWVRALAVDGDDNTLHVGVDDTWPESGKKLTFQGRRWSWSNTQRDTKAQIWIEVAKEGLHQLQISMREDGCELDRIFLTGDAAFVPTDDQALPSEVEKGDMNAWRQRREQQMRTDWVVEEAGGWAAVEVEAVPATAGWQYHADGAGHGGQGYLEWMPAGQGIAAGQGLLSYDFEIRTPGNYQVFIRGRLKDPKNRPDTPDPDGNDVWLKAPGARPVAGCPAWKDGWNKIAILGHPEGFDWSTNLDIEKTHPASPVCVALEAGRFTLELSGRSQGYMADRIVLRRMTGEPVRDFQGAAAMLDQVVESRKRFSLAGN
jgi:hypothetical protein